MEYEKMTPEDYVRCDRIWQRVAPELEPYPHLRGGDALPAPAPECCSLARVRETGELLASFIEEELADRRTYLAHLRCAPPAARRTLRQLADEEGAHARRLMGLYYMLTGESYRAAVCTGEGTMPWQALLRRRYGEECAGGYAYAKAAEETEDMCLRRILQRFSADEYRHAELLLRLLEGNLPV